MKTFIVLCLLCAAATALPSHIDGNSAAAWQKLSDKQWSAREGLMGVATSRGIFMAGGRDVFGAKTAHDVWRTDNGTEWSKVASAPWPSRAYHAFMELKGCLYVMGGQSVSFVKPFYNDVWRSCDDGKTWQSLGNAPWRARAGVAFTTHKGRMYIAGGCYGSSIGKGRKFLSDVWSSADGITWVETTSNASWSPRSGPRLVSFNDTLLIVAGERGFTPDVQLRDVWQSSDGKRWKLLTAEPGWSARSGHGVVVHGNELLVIAGWPYLHDMWSSADGVAWTLRSNATWNCDSDSCGKFDFWSLITEAGALMTMGGSHAYSTFGKLWADTWQLKL